MTNFEAIGVERQLGCSNKFQCRKQFSRSCEMCSSRNLPIDCDCCAIKAAHEAILGSFIAKELETAQNQNCCKRCKTVV